MSLYDELKEEFGDNENFIELMRDSVLEEDSDLITEMVQEHGDGQIESIMSSIEEEDGMESGVLWKNTQARVPTKPLDIDLSDNNHLTSDKMEGIIQPEDVTQTMDISTLDTSKAQGIVNNAMAKSYISGAKTLPIGISVMAQDAYNWIRDFDDGFTKEDYADSMRAWAIENQEKIKRYNKQAGFGEDDILTPDLFGQITAELLALPAGGLKAVKGIKWLKDAKTTTQAAFVEGGLATVSAVGEGKDYTDAAVSGAITATGTKIGGELLEGVVKFVQDPMIIKNIVSGKASDKQTLDYLIKASGETDDAIQSFYSKYSEAIGKNINELNEVDKMQAIVKNSGAGSRFKTEAEYYGEDVLSKTNYFENQIKNLFDKELNGASIPAEKLDEFLSGASKNYEEIKNTLIDNFKTEIYVPKDGLKNLINQLRDVSDNQNNVKIDRVIDKLTQGIKTPLDIEDLIKLKHDINSLGIKSDAVGYKAGKAGEYIEGLVQKQFSKYSDEEAELANKLWGQANSRYSQKKTLESGDNWIATLIQKKGKEKISTDDFANAVMSQTERGAYNFNQLKDFIGEDATAEVEKQIIKNIFEKKDGLNSSLEYIKGFDFVTESGKQLRSELIRLEGVIPKESSLKLLQKFIGSKDVGSVGFSDNLISKFHYSVIGKTYNAIMTRMPSASRERAFRTLGDRLKEGIDDIKINIKDDPELQKAFETELKELELDKAGLKKIGKDRTAAQNKQLAEVTAMANKIQKQLPSPTKAQSKINVGYVVEEKNTPLRNAPSTVTTKVEPYSVKPETKQIENNTFVPEYKKPKEYEVDEVIPSDKTSGDIVDVDIIPNKQLETTKKVTGTDSPAGLNKDVAIQSRQVRKDIVEKTSNKIRNRVFRDLPDTMKDSEETKGFVLEALKNGDVLAKKKVGENIQNTKSGMSRTSETDSEYIEGQNIKSGAIQTNLSRASVNRIKAGRATDDDLYKLAEDVKELKRLDEWYSQYDDVF